MELITDEFLTNVSKSINDLANHDYCDLLIMRDIYKRLHDFNKVLCIACTQRGIREDISEYTVLEHDCALLSSNIMMELIKVLENANNKLLNIIKCNSEIQPIDVYKFSKEINIEASILRDLLYQNNRLGIFCLVKNLNPAPEYLYYELEEESFSLENSFQLYESLKEANKYLEGLMNEYKASA